MGTNRRVTLEPAYVLHRRPFGNTSLLLEMFTAEHGRVGAVARGARSPRARRRGVLQAFRPLLVSWSGRSELVTLTTCEDAEPAPVLQGRGLFAAFYLNELLMRLFGRHDPHPEVFTAYRDALDGLAGGGGVEPVLRRFEVLLLGALGYGLALEQEVDTGRPIEPGIRYHYRLEEGPVRAGAGETELTLDGATLLALARGVDMDDRELGEAKRLTREALALYLGHRPLKTRALFAAGQLKVES